jgi:hypothetical protein
VDSWCHKLQGYHDKVVCEFFRYGWPINFQATQLPIHVVDNHGSANLYSHVIDKYIATEQQHGALHGPFKDRPFHNSLVVSPLQTVSKDSQNTQKRRVVMDLSFPIDCSVNSGIPRDQYFWAGVSPVLSYGG